MTNHSSQTIHGDKAAGNKNIFNFFSGDSKAQRALRNRQNMLQLVWNTWIEGVLQQSPYNEVRIELGLETKPDAVERPQELQVQEAGQQKPERLAAGTTMLQIFDRMNGALLILGEPGSGKTTLLLELCRQAIELAQADPTQPIPVVFNLSSWKPGIAPPGWLVQELSRAYFIPKKAARSLVEGGKLLLLLDGLDEVKAENRAVCVQTINDYRAAHASTRLAVCCRAAEYEALNTRLKLGGALLIQPLSEQQAEGYLQQAGEGLAGVRQWFAGDARLRELAQTPLMLSLFALAFRDADAASLQAVSAAGDYRAHLLDAYIEKMSRREGAQSGHTPEQTRKWLSWLACRMVERDQSLFCIEDIQISWLPWPAKKIRLVAGLLFGLATGLLFGLVTGLFFELVTGLAFGPVEGLVFGLLAGLVAALVAEPNILPAEKLSWSWRRARKGLVIGLVVALVIGLVFGLKVGWDARLVGMLIFLGLVVGLAAGLDSDSVEKRNIAGEGVKTSAKNGLSIGLAFGLFGLISRQVFGLFLMLYGLKYGGYFLITHFAARFLLNRSESLPWNLIPFLDYCTERILLRKAGGGYLFIHRMLMEHFAAAGTKLDWSSPELREQKRREARQNELARRTLHKG